MSEIDDLRSENKELKRLLGNALELLEKSRRALTKQAQSAPAAAAKKSKSKSRSPAKKRQSGKTRAKAV